MKEYIVLTAFDLAKPGDTVVELEDGTLHLDTEEVTDQGTSVRRMWISDQEYIRDLKCNNYISEIHDLEYYCEEDCVCEYKAKLDKLIEFINDKQEQYDKDKEAVIEEYSTGKLPLCVKVEAETVYFNLNTMLNKIKDIINGED